MCAKNHLLTFSSFLDIWENVEWPRFFLDHPVNDKIKHISRARLPEKPEVNHAGHLNIQFLVYHETTTTTTILLKNTQRNKYRKSAYTLADDELWTNQVFISNKFTVK